MSRQPQQHDGPSPFYHTPGCCRRLLHLGCRGSISAQLRGRPGQASAVYLCRSKVRRPVSPAGWASEFARRSASWSWPRSPPRANESPSSTGGPGAV